MDPLNDGLSDSEAKDRNARKKRSIIFTQLIDKYREDLIGSVQELIRVRSIQGMPQPGAPFGPGPSEALETALRISDRLGFSTVNMEGFIGYAEYGEGNEYVAILGHLDIVPEGNGWTFPPYAGEIHDGKIFGRGAIDDKGPTMAALYALKAIKESGLPLKRKIRVIFGSNEETENSDIKYYLKKESPPVFAFTPDGFYPLVYAEKGILEFDLVKDLRHRESGINIEKIVGGNAANMVPDLAIAKMSAANYGSVILSCEMFAKEKGYEMEAKIMDEGLIIQSKGVAVHGSAPEEGKNAIMQLLKFLATLPLAASDSTEVIHFLNNKIGTETDGRSLKIAFKEQISGMLSLNVGKIDMDQTKASLTLDIRYPIGSTMEDILQILNCQISSAGFRIENIVDQKPLYCPLGSPLVTILLDVYREITGSNEPPKSVSIGTYAKEMPNTLAFGPQFSGDSIVEHKPNEYITIENLMSNAVIFAQAIYELSIS